MSNGPSAAHSKKFLEEIHSELAHITSNGTYLSNNKLSNLYSLSIQNNKKKQYDS